MYFLPREDGFFQRRWLWSIDRSPEKSQIILMKATISEALSGEAK